jgi:hypothetical protein
LVLDDGGLARSAGTGWRATKRVAIQVHQFLGKG